jgi:hypothetical protein
VIENIKRETNLNPNSTIQYYNNITNNTIGWETKEYDTEQNINEYGLGTVTHQIAVNGNISSKNNVMLLLTLYKYFYFK